MAGTRSSTRATQQSSPSETKQSPVASAGSKRKLEASVSPSAKRGRKSSDKKEQKTIEDTMDVDQGAQNKHKSVEDGDAPSSEPDTQSREPEKPQTTGDAERTENKDSDGQIDSKSSEVGKERPAEEEQTADDGNNTGSKDEEEKSKDTSKMDDTGKIEPKQQPQSQSSQEAKPSTTNGESAVVAHARDDDVPSSILEKGVIYFFFRGRTGIDNPSDVNDIARSYMILRPIPHGAKIGDGPIGDGSGKCRLLALPKKVLPLSGKDKFMTFVEKSKTTFKELKDEFMSGSDYSTQTAGVRHTPPVTPVAEGVYAITSTGRESHLAYMITIPQELGQVQKDMGIREQGSYITSTKNPQFAGPANTNLPQGPDFPKEILDEFRSLRWAPLQPKFLDYENMQFLLIGESSGIDGATQQQSDDKESDKENAKEELEKLEGEDEIRIKHLKGDDAVFADLGISKKDYPQVPSTWSD